MAHNPSVAIVTMVNMMNQMLLLEAAGGFIGIYTGLQPGSPGGPLNESNVLLVTLALSNPAFDHSSGVSTANAITPGTAVAGGVPTWFRMFEADGVTPIMDGSAGPGSDYVLNLDAGYIAQGGLVSISSFVLNQPVGNPFIGVASEVANSMLNWIVSYVNNGFIEVYSGTQPASADDAVPGGDVLLVTLDLDNPAVSSVADGEMTFAVIAPGSGLANGTPTWFRMYQSDGTTVLLDGSAGFGGEYDLLLGTSEISIGQKVEVASLVMVQN
jgi:hypothetical protein